MFSYHVVTDRPMYVDQQIIFDDKHHSGVYQRVYEKIDIVNGQSTVGEMIKVINVNIEVD